jgi:L-threonylcarbamoyladenylate synthase
VKATVTKAIEVLKRGGIVIFPTDTAFGIGCRIDREDTVKRLFRIRQRPTNQAVPVLVSGIEMAKIYLTPLSDNVRLLMENYWPGGLTIIHPCKIGLTPPLVRGFGSTLGVRMPDHEIALKLIEKVGVPILGASANFSGKPTPYNFSDLDPKLTKLVDYVVPGVCKTKRASTVIDCSVTPWKILRQGNVKVNIINT